MACVQVFSCYSSGLESISRKHGPYGLEFVATLNRGVVVVLPAEYESFSLSRVALTFGIGEESIPKSSRFFSVVQLLLW